METIFSGINTPETIVKEVDKLPDNCSLCRESVITLNNYSRCKLNGFCYSLAVTKEQRPVSCPLKLKLDRHVVNKCLEFDTLSHDGTITSKDAFKNQEDKPVPLKWRSGKDAEVLGTVNLEIHDDGGVYISMDEETYNRLMKLEDENKKNQSWEIKQCDLSKKIEEENVN